MDLEQLNIETLLLKSEPVLNLTDLEKKKEPQLSLSSNEYASVLRYVASPQTRPSNRLEEQKKPELLTASYESSPRVLRTTARTSVTSTTNATFENDTALSSFKNDFYDNTSRSFHSKDRKAYERMRASTQVQSTEEISEEDIKKYTAGHDNNNKKNSFRTTRVNEIISSLYEEIENEDKEKTEVKQIINEYRAREQGFNVLPMFAPADYEQVLPREDIFNFAKHIGRGDFGEQLFSECYTESRDSSGNINVLAQKAVTTHTEESKPLPNRLHTLFREPVKLSPLPLGTVLEDNYFEEKQKENISNANLKRANYKVQEITYPRSRYMQELLHRLSLNKLAKKDKISHSIISELYSDYFFEGTGRKKLKPNIKSLNSACTPEVRQSKNYSVEVPNTTSYNFSKNNNDIINESENRLTKEYKRFLLSSREPQAEPVAIIKPVLTLRVMNGEPELETPNTRRKWYDAAQASPEHYAANLRRRCAENVQLATTQQNINRNIFFTIKN